MIEVPRTLTACWWRCAHTTLLAMIISALLGLPMVAVASPQVALAATNLSATGYDASSRAYDDATQIPHVRSGSDSRRWRSVLACASATDGCGFKSRDAVATNTGLRMGGSSTIGGVDHATEAMIKYSTKNPEAGMFDIIGHDSPNDIAGRSAAEVADRVRAASGGQDIRLLSCRTGCPTGSFAQDLANNLGVRVNAPTTGIGASSRGNTLTIFDGGEW